MDITVTSNLNPARKSEIQYIVDASRQKESITLSFPFEEADLYVCLSEGGRILSAAAFTEEAENTYECAAFTHPDARDRGFFSAVLEAGLQALPEDAELFFYVEEGCRDAENVLYTIGAEHLSDEYMMELSPDSEGSLFPDPFLSPPTSDLKVESADCCGTETLFFSDPFGSVCISVFDSHYYLYGFEIKESERHRGHGKELLFKVLSRLSSKAVLPVTLHVSGDNSPALSLYKKTGFRITEILSCYLY